MSGSPSWDSGLMSALLDPGVGALASGAQAFAQMAMPSRLPVPLGAAIGMGAGGMLQGAQAAQRGQLAAQQIQQAQIANQRSQLGLDWYKQIAAKTAGAPTSTSQASADPTAPTSDASAGGDTNSASSAPSGASPAAPGALSVRGKQITDDNGRYLVSPQQLVDMGNLSFAMGDPGGAATFYGHAQTAAGGAGFAFGPNGDAFAVPGGSQDPRTIYNREAAQKWGGVAPAIAQAGGVKAAEAPYAAPIPVEQPITDANGNVVGTRTVQVPVPQWAAQTSAAGSPPVMQPTGAPRTTVTPQAAGVTAMGSLPDDATRAMAANAALRAGLPTEAWAPWISTLHNESGWNLKAPDNKNANGTYDIGPGQLNSATLPTLGMTEAQARDPATNLLGSAKYFAQQWQASGGDPNKAIAAYHSPAGTAPDLQTYVANGVNRLAQWGYPGTAPSIATTPLGGIPATPAPSTGMGGNITLTPQAKANLDVREAWQKPQDLRVGGMTPVPPGVNPAMPQGGVLKNPQPEQLVGPGGATELFHVTPASPYAPPGTPGEAAPVVIGGAPAVAGATGATSAPIAVPGAPAPGSQAVTKLPPDVVEGREELTKGLFGKDTDAYIAANNTQGWLNQINHAVDVMNKAGSAYQTGPYAETRLGLMNGINDAARTLGLTAPFDQKAMASFEEARKATTTAGFELSSNYEGHARQAAATIMNATSAVPGMSNSPYGVILVSNGINESAQSAIDMHNYKMSRFFGQDPYEVSSAPGTKAGAALESAETDFVKAFPASMYSSRAISTVQPIKINGPEDFNKYLPGTVVIAPNGVRGMVPQRPNAPPIPNYLHGYIQPQGTANATP